MRLSTHKNRYESGGHFRPHKDTEKEAGMFGTLVVQLPTAAGHNGGALIVRHRRQQRVFAWEDPDGSYAQRLGGGAAAAVAGTAAGAPTEAADEVGRGMASTPPSSLPVRCAAFYGDCEHELQTITSGVRLCLLYNLVRTTPGPQPVAAVGQSGSAAQLRLSDAVAAWGRPGSSCDAAKFIVPLAHEYTKASLSFGGLKGRDRAMADSLRACRDLDLYLVTIVKHESGTAQEDPYERSRYYKREKRHKRSRCWGFGCEEDDDEDGEGCGCCGEDESDDESDPEDKEMEEVHETTITAEDWVDGDGDLQSPGPGVDINDHEVLGYLPLEDPDESAEESDDDDDDGCDSADAKGLDLLFPPDTEPTEREYERYTGNCSPTLDFWYHRAALIFWPSSAKMRVELENGPSSALRVARKRFSEYGDAGELPLADLAMIVSLAETKREKPHRQGSYYSSAPPSGHVFMTDARDTADVLALCSRAGAAALDSSRRLLRLLAGGTSGAVGTPGLVSERVSRGVAALVRAVGWQAIGGEVIRVVKACSLEHAGNVAVLVEELSTLVLPRQQQPELQQEGAGVKGKAQASQQSELQDGVDVKAEVQAAQQPVLQHGVDDVKAEVQASQQPAVEDGVDVKAEVQTAQQPVLQDDVGDVKPEVQAVQQPGLEQDGAGVKVEAQASQQPQLQDGVDVKAEVQAVQQPGLEQDGAGVKAEIQAAQQPVLQQEKSSSTGALIASTYVQGITSNPGALERVTSKEVPTIVRLLLLDLPCFSVNASSGVNPVLALFSKSGAVHLPTDVLAKSVHEFRGRLDGTVAAASSTGRSIPAVTSGTVAAASTSTAAATGAGGGQPPPHHSSAVVTLATGLYSRGFQDVAAAAVKTFAEDVLWLTASIDSTGGLEQGFVGAMVMGTRSGDPSQIYRSQGKLKAVLESKAVQAAVRGGGGAGGGKKGSEVFWRALVSERLVNLEAQAAPKLCWRQPNAVFSKDPQIQHFLRGPQSTMIYRGTRGSPFTSIAQARTFSYSFYGVNAKAVARGAGRGAHVEIAKTKDLYEKKVKAHKEVRAEVALLRSLLKSIGSRGGGATAGGANEVSRPTAPLAPVSRNVAGVSRAAEAGNGKIGAAGRRPKREVIDLCDSP
ncbi:conserved unknown protein [Ectocarpus siliculosus]|uniref:Fe2OG dioxygenase domain-containing protein n=1 Tax=Ectocarpus siliculosus TaxID=2880 RepID=D7FJ32_ECTSI|nr:conserved unknown protein [Ectocarpus siliculosus]|eukprot:CBJ49071.1 conserved unknown protein [Ectocarpus siliculosus]